MVRLNWERGSGSHLSMWKVQRLFNWSFLSHRDWSQTPCAIVHLQVPGWTSCQSATLSTPFDAFQPHSFPCTWKGPCSGRYSLKGTTFNCRHWRWRVSARGGSLYQLDHAALASLWSLTERNDEQAAKWCHLPNTEQILPGLLARSQTYCKLC